MSALYPHSFKGMKKSEIKKIQKEQLRIAKREAKEKEKKEIAERKRQKSEAVSVCTFLSELVAHLATLWGFQPPDLSTMTSIVVSSTIKGSPVPDR